MCNFLTPLSVLFFKNCCLHWYFLCWYRSYATSAGKSGYFNLFVCLCVDIAKNVLGTSSGGNTWKHQSGVQKSWFQFLPLCIRAAFSLFRQRKHSGQECSEGAAEEQDTFIPGWVVPGWGHRAVHHKSSEGSWHWHLLFHPSMPSCHLKPLFLWSRSKIVEEVGCGIFFLMPKETDTALLKHWDPDQVVKPCAKEESIGDSLCLI